MSTPAALLCADVARIRALCAWFEAGNEERLAAAARRAADDLEALLAAVPEGAEAGGRAGSVTARRGA